MPPDDEAWKKSRHALDAQAREKYLAEDFADLTTKAKAAPTRHLPERPEAVRTCRNRIACLSGTGRPTTEAQTDTVGNRQMGVIMQLELLNQSPKYPPARLVDPPQRGYLHLAASVAPPSGPPFPRANAKRTELLDRLKALADDLESHEVVEKATVYRAIVVPPSTGYARQPRFHQARYDVAVLIETASVDSLEQLQSTDSYQDLSAAITKASDDIHIMRARCAKSTGDVDKTRPGLFLFNHFVAEDRVVALELWDHLAGWYARETGLDNSTLLQPIDDADYTFVNHARWDVGLPRFLLQQLAKPSFRSYVQTNLLVNRTGAMPVLYHLA